MDPIAGELRGVTLAKVVKWVCATVMIFGGVVPYIPQYREIYVKEDAEGFSMYVCLALLIANTLRILFWFGKRYELPLLLQSIIMNILMLAMIHLCVRVRNKHNLASMRGQEKYFTEEEEDLATLGYDLVDNVTTSNVTTATFLDNSLQESGEEKKAATRLSRERISEKSATVNVDTPGTIGRVSTAKIPDQEKTVEDPKISIGNSETNVDSSKPIETNFGTAVTVLTDGVKSPDGFGTELITFVENSTVHPNDHFFGSSNSNCAFVSPINGNSATVVSTIENFNILSPIKEKSAFVGPTKETSDVLCQNKAPTIACPTEFLGTPDETIIGLDNSSPPLLKRRNASASAASDAELIVTFASRRKDWNKMFQGLPWIPFGSFYRPTYFDWRYFWQWTDFQSYLDFLLALSISLSLLTFLCINSTLFVECLGFMAVFTEAMLGVPQLLKNLRSRSTEGMSILMVLMWTAGDAFKTVYFVVREAPLQFWICGTLQVLIDMTILGQVYWYRTSPAPAGTRSDRVD